MGRECARSWGTDRCGIRNKDSESYHTHCHCTPGPLEGRCRSPPLRWGNSLGPLAVCQVLERGGTQQRARQGSGTLPEIANNSRGSQAGAFEGHPSRSTREGHVQNSRCEPIIPTPPPLPDVSEKLHLSQDGERRARRIRKTAQVP